MVVAENKGGATGGLWSVAVAAADKGGASGILRSVAAAAGNEGSASGGLRSVAAAAEPEADLLLESFTKIDVTIVLLQFFSRW